MKEQITKPLYDYHEFIQSIVKPFVSYAVTPANPVLEKKTNKLLKKLDAQLQLRRKQLPTLYFK